MAPADPPKGDGSACHGNVDGMAAAEDERAIARRLVDDGDLDEEALERAEAYAAHHAMSLGEALVSLGLVEAPRVRWLGLEQLETAPDARPGGAANRSSETRAYGSTEVGATHKDLDKAETERELSSVEVSETLLGLPLAKAPTQAGPPTPDSVPADLGARAASFIGRVLGGYRIDRVIGAGGMAIVFEATQLKLRRTVALKLLAPELLGGSEERIRRFRLEAQAAAQLAHPNVAQIYDVGDVQGTHYIAMEYVEGKSVAHWLVDKGPLEPMRAIEVVRGVALGLRAAARAGIQHRDVKPGNIILGGESDAKLVDFGIALARGLDPRATSPGAVVGTPLYMPPERFGGEPTDQRGDIYSLGVTLLEMLTGKALSLAGRSAAQVAQVIAEACPGIRPELRVGLGSLCARMVALAPEQRPRDYDELVADLDQLMQSSRKPEEGGEAATRALDDGPALAFGTRVVAGTGLALGLALVTLTLARLLYRLNLGAYDKALGIFGGALLVGALATIGVVMAARLGKLKVRAVDRWLRVHMLFGTLAPAVILLHGGAQPGAVLPVLNVAALVVIVASGLTGRFVFLELERRVREVTRKRSELPIGMLLAHRTLRRWRTVHHPLTLVLIALSILHVLSIYFYGAT